MRFADFGLDEIIHSLIADLIPDEYGDYRDLLAESVQQFLRQLSSPRQIQIIESQCALSFTATAPERLTTLIRHSPLLHKLGQLIARHPKLSFALKSQFITLESSQSNALTPAFLSALQRHFQTRAIVIDPVPVAEASIAIVVGAKLGNDEVVIKVKKPLIDEYLAEDLTLAMDIAHAFDVACEQNDLPPLGAAYLIAEIAEKLACETDFAQEQHNLQVASAFYRHSSTLVIPECLPDSTPQMTVMKRLHGQLFTTTSPPPFIGPRLIRELLAKPFWQRHSSALFHGDPHGGNLLLLPDQRIGVLDWGLAVTLTKIERRQLVELALGLWLLEVPKIAAALEKLVTPLSDLTLLIRHSLPQRYSLMPSLSETLHWVEQLALRGVIRLPSHLLILRKTLFMLKGLVNVGHANEHWETAFLEWGLLCALQDNLPWQFDDTQTQSHLSHFDLWQLAVSSAGLPARLWQLH